MPDRSALQTDLPGDLPDTIEPVRKSIRVKAAPAKAFEVFTQQMDSWWPRAYHIGSSPMKRVVVEGRADGAIYTEQEDGTICPWASVKAWEPPHRFVMNWQINPDWQYEPNLDQCSEVEVRFTPADDGTTLVELEHRNIRSHGGACLRMREQVNSEGGWGSLLNFFATQAGGAA